jgi:hypothetical protein
MMLNVINFAAPLFTYSEIATAHAGQNPANGMFDGSLGNVTSSGSAYGAVTLNAKYAGWKVVGLRYIRQNHNNSVKADAVKDARIEVLGEDNVWRVHATVRFPYGEYNSLIKLENNPIAPIPVNSKRQFRIGSINTWGGSTATHWCEFQLVVGY